MDQAVRERKAICVVVENPPHYKKVAPMLEERFNVTTETLIDKSVAKKRFDKKRRIIAEAKSILRIFARISFYTRQDAIVCFARKRHLSYLVFARIVKLFGAKVKLYLYGFYIQSWASNAVINWLISMLFTENTALLVISKTDRKILQAMAPAADIRYYPYCQAPRKVEDLETAELGDYIFAGGYTNRDYDILLFCAGRIPEEKFVIVCSQFTEMRNAVPPNVKIYRDIEGRAFYDLLAKSRLVVVPLRTEGFSSGQTVAIEAMQYGKTTIYTNFENVSQYFDDGITGIEYKAGDAKSLETAIRQIVRDEESLIKMGQSAKEKFFKYYTKDKIDNALVMHIGDFVNRP